MKQIPADKKFYPVLQPFAFLYGIVILIRNLLFDWHLLPSEKYSIPVICVGNIAVGGTGKTPLVEFLIRLLSDKYRIAVLSRGYKRKSSGFVLADEKSTALDIGDEACQLKFKFPEVVVAVDKNRRRGMRNLLAMPETIRPQVVLLDDGFQHRYIKPSFSILTTDYNRLFYKDKLLPVGRLRETEKSVSRTDLLLICKFPENYKDMDVVDVWLETLHLIPSPRLFFSGIKYMPPECVFLNECNPCKLEDIRKDDDILLVTGIANPTPLIEEIKKYSDKVSVIAFADHHAFTKKDIRTIQSVLSKRKSDNLLIICTEKDAARIRTNPYFPNEWKSRMFYIPIKIHFFRDEQQKLFEKRIIRHISSITERCKDIK